MTDAEMRLAHELEYSPDLAALTRQEGGSHYKAMTIQPVQFIHTNGIGFLEGNAVKYLCRHRDKGGAEDLRKARHYIDLLLQLEYGEGV